MSNLSVESIPDKNLFMMCSKLNRSALSQLADSYRVRHCRKDELDLWKDMHFDDPAEAKANRQYMTDFFVSVYAPVGDLFYEKCLFVCDSHDKPIATAFIWKAYDEFNTVHWVKVLKEFEGRGIGRALLSIIMQELKPNDYPVYLHTQPSSYRAIKLYADFGFTLLTDPVIGSRKNHLEECLPILQRYMPKEDFENLEFEAAPAGFLEKLKTVKDNHF